MKLFLFILFFIISVNLCADQKASQAQINWVRMDSPTDKILSTCHFINFNTGWIGGDSGLVMKTTDAGQNWTEQFTGTFANIEKLFFLDQNRGYGLAWNLFPDTNEFQGTVMLTTTNGGAIWVKSQYPDTNRFLRDIFFINQNTGFVGGSPILIAKTTDAGTTWFRTDADTNNIGLPVFSLRFFDAMTGFASGGFRDIAGAMWRTTDGGLHWDSEIVGPEPLTDLHILNPQKVVSVGGDFEFGASYVQTSNGGLNWSYDTLGVFGVALAVDFRTPMEGWIALGTSQKFSYTLNGGINWTNIFTPDSSVITDIDFTDSLHGWAVGYFGAIYKYDGTMSSVGQSEIAHFPGDFTVSQNFPNPFNPSTKIKYALFRSGRVSINVHDVSGRHVRRLTNEFQNAGNYEVEFDGKDLSSGVYFCHVSYKGEVGSSAKVIKLVLTK